MGQSLYIQLRNCGNQFSITYTEPLSTEIPPTGACLPFNLYTSPDLISYLLFLHRMLQPCWPSVCFFPFLAPLHLLFPRDRKQCPRFVHDALSCHSSLSANLTVLGFYCCITNDQRFSILKTTPISYLIVYFGSFT